MLPIHYLNLLPSHLYTVYRALDANRRLMQREKGLNTASSFGPGWAYFVEPQALDQELRRVECRQEQNNQDVEVTPYLPPNLTAILMNTKACDSTFAVLMFTLLDTIDRLLQIRKLGLRVLKFSAGSVTTG
jgi:hypothetical protein